MSWLSCQEEGGMVVTFHHLQVWMFSIRCVIRFESCLWRQNKLFKAKTWYFPGLNKPNQSKGAELARHTSCHINKLATFILVIWFWVTKQSRCQTCWTEVIFNSLPVWTHHQWRCRNTSAAPNIYRRAQRAQWQPSIDPKSITRRPHVDIL